MEVVVGESKSESGAERRLSHPRSDYEEPMVSLDGIVSFLRHDTLSPRLGTFVRPPYPDALYLFSFFYHLRTPGVS